MEILDASTIQFKTRGRKKCDLLETILKMEVGKAVSIRAYQVSYIYIWKNRGSLGDKKYEARTDVHKNRYIVRVA